MGKQTKSTATAGGGANAAGKAAAAAKSGRHVAEKPRTHPAETKADRSEELRFKVTDSVKQSFKSAARELGIKKGVLLERLLADWQARHTPSGRAAKLAQHSAHGATRPPTATSARKGAKQARP